LAKSNIINPTIFNHDDLKSLVEQALDIPVVSLLEVSNIKVFQSENIIHILIAYPRIKFICKKITIFPVSHQHTILQLQDDIIAECKDDVLAVTECTTTTHSTFCKLAAHDTCARALHAGSTALCHSQPSHLDLITYVDDGAIIINESPANISVDDGPEISTTGTHLVTFERLAIINGTKYVNQSEILSKTPGIAVSPLLNIISHDAVLSMPLLHRLNSHNIKTIQRFKDEFESNGNIKVWFAAGVGLGVIFSLSLLRCQKLRRRRDSMEIQMAISKLNMTEDSHDSEGGVVN